MSKSLAQKLAYVPEERREPITDRPVKVLCFGEAHWDSFPTGRKPGGAACNVAYHLHRLGCVPLLVSAVGSDAAGDELLAYLRARGISTELIQRHATSPTGNVEVQLGPDGRPRYDIRSGVAWDEIALNDENLRAARESDAIFFSTLAARGETSRRTLDMLLEVQGPLKMIDMNLRPPFDDRERALALARRSEWIKLNESELGQLTGVQIAPGKLPATTDQLREMTGSLRVCVTRGDRGAVIWQQIAIVASKPPKVKVADTVGASDAFTAALLHGILAKEITRAPEVLDRALRLSALVASLPGGQPDYELPW